MITLLLLQRAFCATATEGKHLVESFREALELILRMVG